MSETVPQLPPPPPPSPEPEGEVKLSFLDHLRDLRVRMVRAMLGIAIGMGLVGGFVPQIVDHLMKPVRDALPAGRQQLVYTSAIEPMMVYIKVAMYGGVFVAAPWVLWQLWLFIAPGLYKREKKVVFPFLFWGTLLFYLGALFCFELVMPQAFPAMLAFAESDTLSPMLSLSEQLSLVLAMLLGFGVVFEVPVVIAFLSMIGLVQWRTLAKYRRIAIIVNVIAAAIITPTGDPLNLALMAVPMIVFYEVGIVLARILGKKPAADAAPAA
ncbi:Sec-independent protein translocase, TatC subunit [Anaeromyxobacter sp. K]|uniref:twin-arginine translocase subunit TatC n=1 Tax=Anaeromyxobacter sp. (strain K) TaxID=447217 RepID=UPI00015F9D6C|nr:twin-arginine translocase subunit TatC [Anaeromyxobacter sp. K]ACG71309.1 Sec-independent protein translocase, TatC subunit [Anaeromyxobacter sp. K]